MSRGQGATDANLLLDVVYELQATGDGTAEANLTVPVSRSFRALLAGYSGLPFQIITGGAASVVKDAASGVRCVQVTSGVGQRTCRVHAGGFWGVPVGAAAGVGTIVPAWRRNRRYTAGALCRWPVRGATVIEVGAVTSNGMLSLLGVGPGFVLSSDPAVNGGLWTPRVRLVEAGGITTLAATALSVPTATQQRFEIRYTEGLVPLLELMIDGATVATRSGLVNMPVALPANPSFHFGFGCSAAAGTTVEYAATWYKIEEF